MGILDMFHKKEDLDIPPPPPPLPPNIGTGANGSEMMHITLKVGERAIAETFVDAYNRSRQLKLVSRLKV